MTRFKLWFYENLAGPGDGPDSAPFDQERMAQDIAAKGAGAFKRLGGDPPQPPKSPTAKYLDPSHRRKMMKIK